MTGMDFGLGRDFGLGMKGEIMELEEVDSYGRRHGHAHHGHAHADHEYCDIDDHSKYVVVEDPYSIDEYNYSHEIDFGYYDEPVVKKSNDRKVDYIIRDERHVGGPSYEVIVDGHRDHDHHGNFAFVEEEFDYVPEIHYDDVVHYDDHDHKKGGKKHDHDDDHYELDYGYGGHGHSHGGHSLGGYESKRDKEAREDREKEDKKRMSRKQEEEKKRNKKNRRGSKKGGIRGERDSRRGGKDSKKRGGRRSYW